MSAFPEPTIHSEGRKLRVSIMLKVPIDLQLEMLGLPSTIVHQFQDQEILIQTEDFGEATLIDEVAKTEIEENIEVLSNQIVNQLLQNCKAFSTPQLESVEDNPEIHEQDTNTVLALPTAQNLEDSALVQDVLYGSVYMQEPGFYDQTAPFEEMQTTSEQEHLLRDDRLRGDGCNGEAFATLGALRDRLNISLAEEKFLPVQQAKPLSQKKPVGRFLDSFNDGFTFALNTVGTIFFLGKLANYSWE